MNKLLLTLFALSSLAIAGSMEFSSSGEILKFDTYEVNEYGEEVLMEEGHSPYRTRNRRNTYSRMRNSNEKFAGLAAVVEVIGGLMEVSNGAMRLVEEGRPVVGVQSQSMSVIPKDASGNLVEALNLSGWEAPVKAGTYTIRAKNLLGITRVRMDFEVNFTPGGSLDGKGKYITGVQLRPVSISAGLGFGADTSYEVQSIQNIGTSENPIAAVVLVLNTRVYTMVQEFRKSQAFFISGDGDFYLY